MPNARRAWTSGRIMAAEEPETGAGPGPCRSGCRPRTTSSATVAPAASSSGKLRLAALTPPRDRLPPASQHGSSITRALNRIAHCPWAISNWNDSGRVTPLRRKRRSRKYGWPIVESRSPESERLIRVSIARIADPSPAARFDGRTSAHDATTSAQSKPPSSRRSALSRIGPEDAVEHRREPVRPLPRVALLPRGERELAGADRAVEVLEHLGVGLADEAHVDRGLEADLHAVAGRDGGHVDAGARAARGVGGDRVRPQGSGRRGSRAATARTGP